MASSGLFSHLSYTGRPTCLGMVLPKVDCALLHQVEIKKKPHSYTYRPVWFSHFFNGGSLFPSVSSWHLKVAMIPVYTLVLCSYELSPVSESGVFWMMAAPSPSTSCLLFSEHQLQAWSLQLSFLHLVRNTTSFRSYALLPVSHITNRRFSSPVSV